MSFLRERWDKNWPELRGALLGGLPRFVLAAQPGSLDGAVPVFCYHAVNRGTLEADLRFLQRNAYVTIDADGLLEHLQRRRPAPTRAVVLSFDDGPRNLHEVVFPLLRVLGQRAVAFIAPAFHADRYAPDVPDRFCTWDEIREMHESGSVDFQSHTLEHRYVPRWPETLAPAGIASQFLRYHAEPRSMHDDFRCARETIEARLGKRVRHLAFPRFDGTPEAERIARACGYLGLWRGLVPGHPSNRPGDDGGSIVRLSGDFVRRLPGRERMPLGAVLRRRYASGIRRWADRGPADADRRVQPADGG